MALIDFENRSCRVTVNGRDFIMRPLTVRGILHAQIRISESLFASDSEQIKSKFEALKAAAVSNDSAASMSALADIYMTALDGISVDDFANLLSLVCEPSDAIVIAAALRGDPNGMPKMIDAIAELHDIKRLLRRLAPSNERHQRAAIEASETDPDEPQRGLETTMIAVCNYLPAYKIEDLWDWPYERLLSVSEQMMLLLSAPNADRPATTRTASVEELASAGVKIKTGSRAVN